MYEGERQIHAFEEHYVNHLCPSLCYRMKFRAALANNDWIVDYNDVIIVLDEKGGASSAAFRSIVSIQADSQRQKCVKLAKHLSQ